jgi:hypothetical protein
MARQPRVYTEQPKVDKESKNYVQIIYDLAASGISDKSIAVKLGCSLDEFRMVIESVEPSNKKYKIALEAGRAAFETEHVEIIEAILNDPETSAGLKYKAARENLKTLEAWAPATRSVKVTVEHGPTTYEFESFSQEQIEQIAQQSAEADTKVEDNQAED